MLQDFFLTGRLKKLRKKLTKQTNELTTWGRENNIPVIWVRQEFSNDLSDAPTAYREQGKRITIAGTPGCQLLPELETKEGDFKIIKKRYSAFFKTDLEKLLTNLDVDTLIVAGVNTHACIRTAAIDAYQMDYNVILAENCVNSYDKTHHKISLAYMTRSAIVVPMTNNQILKILN